MPKQIRTEFCCPKCGSYMFGSSQEDGKDMIRHCHGNEQWRCGFTFPQKDDHLYFKEVSDA